MIDQVQGGPLAGARALDAVAAAATPGALQPAPVAPVVAPPIPGPPPQAKPPTTINEDAKKTIAHTYYKDKPIEKLTVGELISGAVRQATGETDLKDVQLKGPPKLTYKEGKAEGEVTFYENPITHKKYAVLELQIEIETQDSKKIIIPQKYYTNLELPTPGPAGNPTIEEKQFNKHLKALFLSAQNQLLGIAPKTEAGSYPLLTKKVNSLGRRKLLLEADYEYAGKPLYGRVFAWTPAMHRTMHGFSRAISTIRGLSAKQFKEESRKIKFHCPTLEARRKDLADKRKVAWDNEWLKANKDVAQADAVYQAAVQASIQKKIDFDRAISVNSTNPTLQTEQSLSLAKDAFLDAEESEKQALTALEAARRTLSTKPPMPSPAAPVPPKPEELASKRTDLLQELQIATDLTAQLSGVQTRSEGGKPTVVGMLDRDTTIAKGAVTVDELAKFHESQQKERVTISGLRPTVEQILPSQALDPSVKLDTVSEIDAALAMPNLSPYHKAALNALKQRLGEIAAIKTLLPNAEIAQALQDMGLHNVEDLSTKAQVEQFVFHLPQGHAARVPATTLQKSLEIIEIRDIRAKLRAPHPLDSIDALTKQLADPLIKDLKDATGKPISDSLQTMLDSYRKLAKPEAPELHSQINAAKEAVKPALKRSRSQLQQLNESLGMIFVLAQQLKAELLANPEDPANKEVRERYNEFMQTLKASGYTGFGETVEQLDLIQEKLGIAQIVPVQKTHEVPILAVADLSEIFTPPTPKPAPAPAPVQPPQGPPGSQQQQQPAAAPVVAQAPAPVPPPQQQQQQQQQPPPPTPTKPP